MSRIGKKPVAMPSGVSASVSGQTIEVKGPKGTRSFRATDDVTLTVEDDAISVTPRGKSNTVDSSFLDWKEQSKRSFQFYLTIH